MKEKLEVMKIDVGAECWCCKGTGCPTCNKGKFEETHYIFIVNGMAIDGDSLK